MTCLNYKIFQRNLFLWNIGVIKNIVFNYQTHFTFSEIGETKDNIPQLAHVDMKDVGTKFERGICISNLVLVLLLSMKVG